MIRKIITVCLVLAFSGEALAGLTQEEISQLGKTLTPVGAEKAGNKDGSIPPYTGGLTAVPANFKKGSGIRPDPFAGERPLFSISEKNVGQYADKLTEGTKAMMKKYPGYRVDVYQTHRSAALPNWVNENTRKNAGKAQLTDNGEVIRNAKSAIPFPIPKNGSEAIWNHLLRYEHDSQTVSLSYTVDANGRMYQSSKASMVQELPYWHESEKSIWYLKIRSLATAPPRLAGEGILLFQPLNVKETNLTAHLYLPGQRRVKLAPEISFDTPDSATSGGSTYDDNQIFNGSLEKYNWKLIGKKEKFVPYNTYKLSFGSTGEELFKTKYFVNPDLVRWELHRVWVVEATLKSGQRHVYKRRVFYLDEDTWAALATEVYDGQGQVYRTSFAYMTQCYDTGVPYFYPFGGYDLVTKQCWLRGAMAETGGVKFSKPLPAKEWSPEVLSNLTVR